MPTHSAISCVGNISKKHNRVCRYMPVEGTEQTADKVRVGEFTLASGN